MATGVVSGCSGSSPRRMPVVAIIGGGCAGTLVAVNLLRRSGGPLRVVMIERSGCFGPGVAYATENPQHLLNVPAESMSAFCDEPLHFAEWASGRLGGIARASYLPRGVYGEYLRAVLARAREQASRERGLELIAGEVIDLDSTSAGVELTLADTTRIACDLVVLAAGPPQTAGTPRLPLDPRVIADPWAPGALSPRRSAGLTLIIGTGLSGVDAALSTCAGQGRALMLSRGGLLPHAHLPGLRAPAPAPAIPQTPLTLAELEWLVRNHVLAMEGEGYDWRDAIDGLRGVTPQLWGALQPGERRRFLRERLRAWETRRHRMAPAVAARLWALLDNARVSRWAGTMVAARARKDAIEVDVAPSSTGSVRTLVCERVVVCTGAGMNIRRSTAPLLQRLLGDGSVSPDPLGLGLRSTAEGVLVDVEGRADWRLLTLGALRRGELWETTAVQEIRTQAESLAGTIERSLSAAHASLDHRTSGHSDSPLHVTTRPPVSSGR